MIQRMESLEMHCAYLQKHCDELSTMVFEQQQEIYQLSRSLDLLHKKIQDLISPALPGPSNEQPPHY